MFIQTEGTPNPETLKFLPGRAVMAEGTWEILTKEEARSSPLATKIFDITGISGLFFGHNFISVTKEKNQDWMVLKPLILGQLMDYFMRHPEEKIQKPLSGDSFGKGENSFTDSSSEGVEEPEVVREIIQLIDSHVRPAVAQDGGDITFEKFEKGVVFLRLQGACSGCPTSTLTLKSGIENMLRHYIPEVLEVKAI